MTVALGLVCSDGVLVAADSQATSGNIAQPAQKVMIVEDKPVVWAGSGSVYVIEEVEAALRQWLGVGMLLFDLHGLRQELAQVVRTAMSNCYQSAMPGHQIPAASFVFLGLTEQHGEFLLEIAGNGELNWHTARRYYAIGSGRELASVAVEMMRVSLELPLTLREGQVVAYRAIETTCAIAAGHVGVGGPVQMAVVDGAGSRILERPELDEIENLVQGWKAMERSMLTLVTADSVPIPAAPPEL